MRFGVVKMSEIILLGRWDAGYILAVREWGDALTKILESTTWEELWAIAKSVPYQPQFTRHVRGNSPRQIEDWQKAELGIYILECHRAGVFDQAQAALKEAMRVSKKVRGMIEKAKS